MGRPRTGSVLREGDHFVARVLLDGKTVRIHLPADIQGTPLSEAHAKDMAKRLSEKPEEARRILEAQQNTRRGGSPLAKGETFDAYLGRWLDERERAGYSSISRDRGSIRMHVSPIIGDKVLTTITRRDLEQAVKALDDSVIAERIAWKTAKRVWDTVRKLFKDACRSKNPALRVRDDNPASEVEPPDRGVEKAKVYLYPDEFLRLVQCEAIPLAWRRLFAVAVYLFPRFSELERLKWEDIDLERRIINICRAWDDYRKVEKEPKGGRARRFYFEPALVPLLRVLHAESGGTGYIFLGTLDKPAASFRECLLTAGIDRPDLYLADATHKRITFHDLRATGITWMALRKDGPMVIQQRAGHADFDTTQGYIREAESIRGNVEEPFPPLPECLLVSAPSSGGGSRGGRSRRRNLSGFPSERGQVPGTMRAAGHSRSPPLPRRLSAPIGSTSHARRTAPQNLPTAPPDLPSPLAPIERVPPPVFHSDTAFGEGNMRQAGVIVSGLRKKRAPRPGEPLRVLVADEDSTLRHEIGALLVEKYTPALALEAGNVPSAIEALLVRHPDLVVADLCLSGHPQGGFRLILDAVSLGVPVVVASGQLSRPLEQRLAELGVGWVQKGASESALFGAVDRALARTQGDRPEAEARKPASGPRMHTA